MREGELLYFSEEEFALMLELAGGNKYSLFLADPKVDERRLTEAFLTLFQRGLLLREQDSFVPSEDGVFFKQLRNTSHIVLLRTSTPEERTVLCYVQKNTLWIAELQNGPPAERYRLRTLPTAQAIKWLSDTAILPQPILSEEDTPELKLIFPELSSQKPDCNSIAQITKYTGSGTRLREYVLYPGHAGPLLQVSDGENVQLCIYTQEKLNELLLDCFGG